MSHSPNWLPEAVAKTLSKTDRLFTDFNEMFEFMKEARGVWKTSDDPTRLLMGYKRIGRVKPPTVKQVYLHLRDIKGSLPRMSKKNISLIKTLVGRKHLAEVCSFRKGTSCRS
jgi:hypothetical protein